MAFPLVFGSNFESGSSGWDSETDTDGILDIASYRELARFPWPNCTPYSGAYCLRVAPNGGTNAAYLEEADINISANTTNYFSFNLWFSPTFTGTANDTCNIFECLASSTVEAAFGFRVVASTNVINLGIGEVAPTSFGAAIQRGRWYTVELVVDVDNAGSNDGTIDIYVTEEGQQAATSVYATQVGSLDQGAITDGRLGLQNHLATTTGTILIDNFKQDDARLFADRRWQQSFIMDATGHAFVGSGKFNVALLSGAGTDNVLTVYDTDRAYTNVAGDVVAELKNTANNERVEHWQEIYVSRGAYIVMSGTNPRAQVNLCRVNHFSSGAVKNLGLRAA